ncbi:MAG: molybdopterin-dependent oxidoreductase [Geovibrio sp.]|nr:molybdopterin-dependent oxidoreductase [Geovibrio sp.]
MSETAKKASVYIPVATYAEKDGSFTSLEGRVQSVNKALCKGLKTDAEVISALAERLGGRLTSCSCEARELIRKEVPLYKTLTLTAALSATPMR